MVFQIKGQTIDIGNSQRFYRTLFVECGSVPDRRKALSLLETAFVEKFDETSITIEERQGWDVSLMVKAGFKVVKI